MPSQPVGRKLSLLSCCSIAGPSRIYEWERDREEVGLSLASSEKDDSWEEMLEIRLTCGATSRYNCSSRSADSSIAPPSSGARSSRISSSLLGAIGTDGKDQSLFFLAGRSSFGADLRTDGVSGIRAEPQQLRPERTRRLRASYRCSQLTCHALCWPPGQG